jgi:cell division protein FtsB
MLNEQINKYKDLYSEMVSAFARLHNAHMPFVINKGRDTGFAVRKELRTIEQAANELKKLSQRVSKESLENRRL